MSNTAPCRIPISPSVACDDDPRDAEYSSLIGVLSFRNVNFSRIFAKDLILERIFAMIGGVKLSDILKLIERAFKFVSPGNQRPAPALVPVPARNGRRPVPRQR